MKPKGIYIIAEAGVNHNGSLDMAKQLIDIAFSAGADAVKFQTFKAEKLVGRNTPKAEYQIKATAATETQWDMLKRLELDEEAHNNLIEYCQNRGIQFLSTPFDEDSLELLAYRFNLPYIKIPSGEITNGPFLLKVASTGKPIILSTGMSTLGDIENALEVIAFGYCRTKEDPSKAAFQKAYCSDEGQQHLKSKVTLLHCTTEYPALFSEVNLSVLTTLQAAFGLSVGYSDHTMGFTVPVAAAAIGAVLIEKHFTMDKSLPGPDHKASLDPRELAEMIKSIRQVEEAIGSPIKVPTSSEIKNKSIIRKSIVTSRMVKKGEVFSTENLIAKRPGNGISPMQYWSLIGKVADRDYAADEMVRE